MKNSKLTRTVECKDAAYNKPDYMPKEVPMTVQERAYTSPIWYTP